MNPTSGHTGGDRMIRLRTWIPMVKPPVKKKAKGEEEEGPEEVLPLQRLIDKSAWLPKEYAPVVMDFDLAKMHLMEKYNRVTGSMLFCIEVVGFYDVGAPSKSMLFFEKKHLLPIKSLIYNFYHERPKNVFV
jgi:hypothetical protein